MPSEELVKDPVYQQLNRLLRKLLSSDEYAIGDKFLTERQVGERFGVSRPTANKALSNLVSERLLQFKKGVGTFIRAKPAHDEVSSLVSFTHNVRERGMTPRTCILRFDKIAAREAADCDAENALCVGAEEPLYLIERLRLADEIPMMLEHRYLVARYCPDLTSRMLEGSLYSLFDAEYGLTTTGSNESIQAVTIEGREAELLKVPSGKAGFLVSSVGFIDTDTPLWCESTLHRPDGFEFRCRVIPAQTEQKVHQRIMVSRTFRPEKHKE
jgi:GntR family transcriptional regulator